MRKYAVYRNEVGLYAKEYVDDLERCQDYPGGFLIREEVLPVVFNEVGGHCSFYPLEDNFVKIIEVEDGQAPLTREQMYPKNSADFEYGWISPEGETYHSGWQEHRKCAKMICQELGVSVYNGENYLEENGWIKVTKELYGSNAGGQEIFVKDLFVTKRQADTLFDLGLYEQEEIKFIIELSQERW